MPKINKRFPCHFDTILNWKKRMEYSYDFITLNDRGKKTINFPLKFGKKKYHAWIIASYLQAQSL